MARLRAGAALGLHLQAVETATFLSSPSERSTGLDSAHYAADYRFRAQGSCQRRPPRRNAPPLLPPPAGKAGWIAGTSFLILIVPLIIEMDREQQVRGGEHAYCSWWPSRPRQLRFNRPSSH